ncbi:Hypothetical protein ORPV_546 [Orpheovirus IHUMI-LCC2]|uniref:Uncharacterized protein n=1 Tax=Orpheovirus IHUMI-LCC2 TaxID=2023057 RepID=A0A2I2L4M2_9VIRU|nr:Hypothetical protein ORPV_546 [Orpheovirus IHUMI-LCC2]SNW62450.1 Hypothetical protein ORPV_546 [Orpheovirus IHUMI-LCC2]
MEKVQELMRVLDATLYEVNKDGAPNGQNSILISKFLLSFPGMKEYVGDKYYDCVDNNIKAAEEKIEKDKNANVREQTKNMWMYPNYKYDPWNVLEVDNEVKKEELQSIKFKIEFVDGKVYAKAEEHFTSKAFDLYKHYLTGLVPNVETSHITLVNSNVVYKLGNDKVQNFVNNYMEEFTVTVGDVKHTVSRDWARFSVCYVLEVASEYVNKFLSDFNEEFKTNIKPSPHVTFAIKPRTLF